MAMGMIYYGAPRRLITELHNAFKVETFVETGTFRGQTTEWASGIFSKVYSVEAQPEIYAQTTARLSARTNITIRNTDTRSFLRELVPTLKGPAVFWLDAHWCGSAETHGSQDECPLTDELRFIGESPLAHFVFVDDARLFLSPPGAPHNYEIWPSIRELMSGPLLSDRRYFTVIRDDILMAVPSDHRRWLIEYVRAEDAARQSDELFEQGIRTARVGLKQAFWGARRKLRKLIRT
ncbi:MAG: hypothetical protein JST54_08050 [Deltaproteobacteria bacterium]|nr:hypothetical protein [Deltaproteobacteria bacterium]